MHFAIFYNLLLRHKYACSETHTSVVKVQSCTMHVQQVMCHKATVFVSSITWKQTKWYRLSGNDSHTWCTYGPYAYLCAHTHAHTHTHVHTHTHARMCAHAHSHAHIHTHTHTTNHTHTHQSHTHTQIKQNNKGAVESMGTELDRDRKVQKPMEHDIQRQNPSRLFIGVFCWLLPLPPTCNCCSGMDLLRHVCVLPH